MANLSSKNFNIIKSIFDDIDESIDSREKFIQYATKHAKFVHLSGIPDIWERDNVLEVLELFDTKEDAMSNELTDFERMEQLTTEHLEACSSDIDISDESDVLDKNKIYDIFGNSDELDDDDEILPNCYRIVTGDEYKFESNKDILELDDVPTPTPVILTVDTDSMLCNIIKHIINNSDVGDYTELIKSLALNENSQDGINILTDEFVKGFKLLGVPSEDINILFRTMVEQDIKQYHSMNKSNDVPVVIEQPKEFSILRKKIQTFFNTTKECDILSLVTFFENNSNLFKSPNMDLNKLTQKALVGYVNIMHHCDSDKAKSALSRIFLSEYKKYLSSLPILQEEPKSIIDVFYNNNNPVEPKPVVGVDKSKLKPVFNSSINKVTKKDELVKDIPDSFKGFAEAFTIL